MVRCFRLLRYTNRIKNVGSFQSTRFSVDVVKDAVSNPAKLVFVRNRNKKKDYLAIISADITLDEDEIIRVYGKRWDIEVFFKICKSYLQLTKECRSLSYDAMTAHVAVVFVRYMMLAVENRSSSDKELLVNCPI